MKFQFTKALASFAATNKRGQVEKRQLFEIFRQLPQVKDEALDSPKERSMIEAASMFGMLKVLVLGWVKLNIMHKQNNKNGKRINKRESLAGPFLSVRFFDILNNKF